uniref:Uncharacterized protein n=1 Tax=Xenopus tropicalis TaxID=8364 RepID=A0A1B8XVF4_XENTR
MLGSQPQSMTSLYKEPLAPHVMPPCPPLFPIKPCATGSSLPVPFTHLPVPPSPPQALGVRARSGAKCNYCPP